MVVWQMEGIALFGVDPNLWEFICPTCGTVQRPVDFLNIGMQQQMVDRLTGTACVQRWKDQSCKAQDNGSVLIQISETETRTTFEWNK